GHFSVAPSLTLPARTASFPISTCRVLSFHQTIHRTHRGSPALATDRSLSMLDTILDAVGHTPLVLLNRMTGGLEHKVAVKGKMTNPGGSVKGRVAMARIAEAEQKGLLRQGGTIIEATAGNTGVGLAMVAAVKGYRCIFVLPDKMSAEKISLL